MQSTVPDSGRSHQGPPFGAEIAGEMCCSQPNSHSPSRRWRGKNGWRLPPGGVRTASSTDSGLRYGLRGELQLWDPVYRGPGLVCHALNSCGVRRPVPQATAVLPPESACLPQHRNRLRRGVSVDTSARVTLQGRHLQTWASEVQGAPPRLPIRCGLFGQGLTLFGIHPFVFLCALDMGLT